MARPLPGTQGRKVAFVAWETAGESSPHDRALRSAGEMLDMPPTLPLKSLYPSGRTPSPDLYVEAAAPWEAFSVATREGSLQQASAAGAPWLQNPRLTWARRSCRYREESERAVVADSAVLEEGGR